MSHLTYAQAVVTGLIQGVTELFPVSSLGHNVLLPALIGGQWAKDLSVSAPGSPYLAFIVGLHVATALAMILYFWQDWVRIVRGFFSSVRRREIVTADQRLAWMIVLATIPVGIAGAALQKVFVHVFAKPELTALFLAANGLILLYCERQRRARAGVGAGAHAQAAAGAPAVAGSAGPGAGPAYGGPAYGGPAYGGPVQGRPGYGGPVQGGGPGYGGPGYGGPGQGGYQGYSQQPQQQQWQGQDPRYGQDDWQYGRDAQYGQDPLAGQDPQAGHAPQAGQDPWAGQDPQYGNAGAYGQDPQYGNAGAYGQDPRAGQAPQAGQDPWAGQAPQYGNTGQYGTTGQPPQYGQDPRVGQAPQYGDVGQYGQDPRAGQAPWAGEDRWDGQAPQQARDPWGGQDDRSVSSLRLTQEPGSRHAARRAAAQEPSQNAAAVAADQRLSVMGWGKAILVGSAQVLALLPGISRDGIVTVAGMGRGLSREDAVRFSFLLSAPVILAAGLLKAHDLLGPAGKGIHGPVIVGSLLSFVGAYLSVRFLTKYFSESRSLTPFGIYCLAAGLLSFLYLLIK